MSLDTDLMHKRNSTPEDERRKLQAYWPRALLQRRNNGRIDRTASDLPITNATKHKRNTEWLSDAPKYCQNAAPGPG